MKPTGTLRAKLLTSLAWTGGGTFLAMCIVVAVVTLDRHKLEAARFMSSQTDTARALIEDYLRSDSAFIRGLLDQELLSTPHSALNHIQDHLDAGPGRDLMYMLGPDGRVQHVAGPHREFIGLDLSQLQPLTEGAPVSGSHQSLFTRRSVVSVLFPLEDGGVVVLERDLRRLAPLMDYVDRDAVMPRDELFILAADGTVVYHPDQELVRSRHNLGLELTHWEGPDDDGLYRFDRGGVARVGYLESMDSPAGWTIVYTAPWAPVLHQVMGAVSVQAATLAAAFLVLFLVLWTLLERNLTAPVRAILDYIDRYRLEGPTGRVPEKPLVKLREPQEITDAVADLTKQVRQFSLDLEAREQLFRTITEFSYHWAVLSGPDGRIQYVSPSCERITGYRAEEFLNTPDLLLDIVHEGDQGLWAAHAAEVDQPDDDDFLDFRIVTRNGEERWIRHFCRRVVDASGNVLGRRASNTDITTQKQAEDDLFHHAFHDLLTGLPNRRLLLERLEQAQLRQRRRHDICAVLFMDLDRFKVINDSLGHGTGDQLLRAFATRLSAAVRPQDSLARVGGDEFAVLMEGVRSKADAVHFAQRLCDTIALPFDLDGHQVYTSASIGIALSLSGQDDTEDLLRDADTAMYRAKAKGPGNCQVFDRNMHELAVARLNMETDLKRALEAGELRLHYQPVMDLQNRSFAGFEALIRWYHPQRGVVPPDDFLPVAEETGLMQAIGDWVLFDACRQLGEWRERGCDLSALRMHVNLAGAQFEQADLAGRVGEALSEHRLQPRNLTVEVTESQIIDHADELVRRTFRELTAVGVGLALDDFGTGFSSLTQLRNLPFTVLKIDRSFVQAMCEFEQDAQIVRSIIDLGRALDLKVVAEGVEKAEHADRLTDMGCQFAQGYLFARALEAESALAFARRHSSDLHRQRAV